MFLFNLALTLYTMWATFTDDYTGDADQDEVGTGDVLQALIRHVQHFIIITRLGLE